MTRPDFSKYKLISFDVFDTLVSRLLARPRDVFKLVELRAGRTGIDVPGFADARVVSERAARARDGGEVTLAEIYEELGKALGPDTDTDTLMRMELDAERDVCVANPRGRALWDAALGSGVPVVITSDMYLPSAFVEELLQSSGYEGWARCFVSCECGATKATGALYSVVAGAMGVKPLAILHIGDNPKSDILRARRAGLAAYKVEAIHPEAHSLAESFVLGAQFARDRDRDASGAIDLASFGYRCLGPVLVGFCMWLAGRLRKNDVEKVFYLARDGLIVQRAMETLGFHELAGTYLYASRRALQVPSFALLDSFAEIVDSMFLPRVVTLCKVFEKAGLAGDVAAEVMRRVGINPNIEKASASLPQDADASKAYDALAPMIKDNSGRELELLEGYLKQEGFSGKVAIVDIGWFGNMQVALERVCADIGIRADIHGYYVGLSPKGSHQKSHRMAGYLFDAMHGRELFEQERCYNLIFETLFSALHGTARGYRKNGNRIEPILADYDGIEAEVGHEAETARQGALDFTADWARVIGGTGLQISPELALRALNQVGVHPNDAEAEYFGDWGMEADGGIIYAAKPASTGHYVTHPKELASDFAHASWKVGFLKRLFKVPLPYGRMWMWIHTAYKMRH